MKKYVRVLASVILLAVMARRLDWPQVGAAFEKLQLGLWLLAIVVYLVVQVVSSVRWRMLAHVQGYDAPVGVFVAYYYIGMLFSLVLPTSVGGDVVRVWYLANRDGTGPREGRRTAAFISVMAERVNGIIVLILLACVAVIFSPTDIPMWISSTVAAFGFAALIALIVLPLLGRLFRKYPAVAQHPRLVHLRRLVAGSLVYRGHPGMLVVVTVLSVFVQVGNVVMWWLVGMALGIDVSPWYYGVLVPLVSLATLLPSISGIGVREATAAILLAPLGVQEPQAVTLAFLAFLATVVCSLCGMFFYLFGHFPSYDANKVNAPNEDVPSDT